MDKGKSLGLHGRASNIPARNVYVDGAWDGDDYWIWATGKVRESTVFGENITLTRKISAKLGVSKIFIEDTVENLGFEIEVLASINEIEDVIREINEGQV